MIDQPPPLPKEFAFTFSMPYGQGDEFPREPEEFDRMLGDVNFPLPPAGSAVFKFQARKPTAK